MKDFFIICLLILLSSSLYSFAGGTGSAADPWQIATPEHLDEVRNYLGSTNTDKHFILISDIDLDIPPYNNGDGWQPIGNASNQFTGNFNGAGYGIYNLFINRPNTTYVGLFGYTSSLAAISDLAEHNVNITGNSWVGALAGNNRSTLNNCCVSGDVYGNSIIGGLTGYNVGNIDSCYTTGSLSAYGNNGGGLVGRHNEGVITNSGSSTLISGTGNNSYGGLVGWNDSVIESCFADGNVNGSLYSGGLVGRNYDGSITNSYATGNVVSFTNSIGGLVGFNGGLPTLQNPIIVNSYATGDVEGDSSVGGLAGENSNLISNCYATGSVWGSNVTTFQQGVGGLVGENNQNGIIEYSYAVGHVSGNPPMGGLVGYNANGMVSYSYWNIETSAQNSSAGGLGLNTIQMLQAASFQNWDFSSIWQNMENITYPFLLDNPQDPPPGPSIPIIIVTPLSFNLIVELYTITEELLIIQNVGSVDLTFDIYIDEILQNQTSHSVQREEWLSLDPLTGVVPSGESSEITVLFDATTVSPDSVYQAQIFVVNNAGDPVVVDVSMEVTLPFLPPPENLQVNDNSGHFIWDEPDHSGMELLLYNVYLDYEFIESTEATEFQYDNLINGQTYTAGVSAEYDLGESAIATYEFIFQGTGLDNTMIPIVTKLYQNYPNPFNPTTTISFDIKETESGRLTIFNLRGQIIVSEVFASGQHSYQWNGGNCGTGLYFYRLRTDEEVITRKMVMMK